MEDDKLFLMRITTKTGEVVAEAPLRIYDPEKAMALFLTAFGANCERWAGSILQGMMVACNANDATGGILEIRDNTPSTIVIPSGSPMPPDPRGRW